MLTAFLDVMRLKNIASFGREPKESDRKVHKTQSEIIVISGAVFEAQHFALSKVKKALSCRQQLQDVKKILDLARENVTNVDAASAETFVQSKSPKES